MDGDYLAALNEVSVANECTTKGIRNDGVGGAVEQHGAVHRTCICVMLSACEPREDAFFAKEVTTWQSDRNVFDIEIEPTDATCA